MSVGRVHQQPVHIELGSGAAPLPQIYRIPLDADWLHRNLRLLVSLLLVRQHRIGQQANPDQD